MIAGTVLSGCAAYSTVETIELPLSGRKVDVARHRSDVRLADCGTLNLIQTYDEKGNLFDSKEARGSALHCDLAVEVIRGGGYLGAASIIAHGAEKAAKAAASASNSLEINNANTNNAEGYYSGVFNQTGTQNLTQNPVTNNPPSVPSGHGNNGIGNGSNDGTNPGTNHHHNNGDNN